MNVIDFRQIRGPGQSKRENFEKFVSQLLLQEVNAEPIEGRGGDLGVDCYVGKFRGQLYVFQAKYFTEPLTKGQRAQVIRSFKSAQKSHQVKGWALCVPHDSTPSEREWFDAISADCPVSWWGETKLRSLAVKYPELTELYFGKSASAVALESIQADVSFIARTAKRADQLATGDLDVGDRALLSEQVLPAYLADKTKGFTGRESLFRTLDEFLTEQDRGYLVVKALPGMGKTTFAAELVRRNAYPAHFVSSLLGVTTTDQFVRTISRQLSRRFGLPAPQLPSAPIDDGRFFTELLYFIESRFNKPEDRLVVVIDGLDEADVPARPAANTLHLPSDLPSRVYLVVTSRPVDDLRLFTTCPQEVSLIDPASVENRGDLGAWLNHALDDPKIEKAVRQAGSKDRLISLLLDKSEGNFMYIRFVVQDIARGKLPASSLDDLPVGLKNYYDQHWRTIQVRSKQDWDRGRLPIISALALAGRPVSVALLAKLTNVSLQQVRAALREWNEFLIPTKIQGINRYRIYHSSFADFLKDKSDVGEIDFAQVEDRLADSGLDSWLTK